MSDGPAREQGTPPPPPPPPPQQQQQPPQQQQQPPPQQQQQQQQQQPKRRRPRLLAWFLPALLAGALAAWLAFHAAERAAGRQLELALAERGLTARWEGVRLSGLGVLLLDGLRLSTPGRAELTVDRLRLIPAGPADLLTGAAGRWRVEARRWRLELSLPGGPALHGRGEAATLEFAAGTIRATVGGEIVAPVRTALRATGLRNRGGPAQLRLAFEPPLPLGTLLASGPALAAPPLPRWLHPLTVQAVSWSGGTGMLTLERVGLTRREGDAGLAGQIARIEVALGDPDDRARVPALRSLRLLRPRLELDLAGFTGRTETARAADAGPAPAAGSGEPAAEGRLEQMVLRLVELLQLSSAPALARLDELAAEDGELRLTLAGEQVVLSRVEVQVRPPRSLELRAAASGPWESSADLSGELAWPRWQEGTLQLEGRLALSDGRLFHPPIAPQPIEQIEVRGRGRLVIHPATGELALEMGQLLVQGLQTSLAVRAQGIGTRPPDFSLTLGLPPQPCQQLADALPAGLAPLLEGMRLQGEMAGELHLALSLSRDEEKVRDLSLKGPGLESCAIRSLGKVRVEKLKDEFVHRIEIPDRSGKAPREVEVGPGTESYVNLQEIPAHVLKSMVVTENISFYEGGPISLGLVRGALNLNLTHQRYVYGGSTISQQLVKNLFLSRHKNLARKLQEAFIAWRMEELLGKDRILELYVNCIEFGPGIYGIEQAARYYFGHGARELSPVQGAFLAAIKPAPGEGPRTVRRGRLEGWVEERMTRAMASLEKDGLIDAAERQAAYPFQLTFRTGEERVAGQQQGQADPDEERDGPAGGTGEHRAHGR